MARDTAQHDEGAFRELLQSVSIDTSPPPGCEERLRERLIARIRSRESGSAERGRASGRRVWIFSAASAAAATLIAVFVMWLLVGGGVGTAEADFAEMLRRVRQASTVAYDTILRVPGQAEITVRVLMAYPSRARVVWPNGKTSIFNHAQRTCLTLKPATKKATLMRMDAGNEYSDPLADLRQAELSTGRFVARETLDGREVDVYEVPQTQGVMKVSVDSRSQLPARIEVTTRTRGGEDVLTILTNFAWDQPISDSLFSLAVPAGYTLVDTYRSPSERSLIELLRACAQMGHGTFPPALDAHTVLSLVLKRYGQHSDDPMYTSVTPTVIDIDDEAKGIYRACLRGLAFVEQVSRNGSWRYVGRGVELGNASAEVCWWKPAGSASFRAVYGDLQIRDVAAEDLPLSLSRPASKPTDSSPSQK